MTRPMGRDVLGGLAVAALALVAVLGLELADTGAGPSEDPARSPTRLAAPVQATAARVRTPDQSGDWVTRILARPLFSPDRRPAPPAAAGSVQAAAASRLPRLSGIMIGPEGGRAIFAATGDGRPVVLAEGGNLAGFTIQAIGAGTVTVTGPDGRQDLRPSFDANPATQADTGGLVPGRVPGQALGQAPGFQPPPFAGGDLRFGRNRGGMNLPPQSAAMPRYAQGPDDAASGRPPAAPTEPAP